MKGIALILSLALVACQHPETAPAPELPPIPESVASPLGPVPVRFADSLTFNGKTVMGGLHTTDRIIYLHENLRKHLPTAWATLEHEVAHLILWDSGLANLIPPDLQQALADAIASYRVAAMLSLPRKP